MRNTVSVLALSLCLAVPAFAQNAPPPANEGQLTATLRDTRAAAERGNAAAQYNLGVMYEDGRGVTRDDAQAAAWYRKAADQGDAVAKDNLRLMHEQGRGVAK